MAEVTAKTDPANGSYRISAIVSCFNSYRFIEGCLNDLESQTIADQLEIIVVNSGSEQDEEKVIRKFQETYDNIRYLRTDQRESVYAAWNRAIRIAQGTYITNANTDDRHRYDAFERMTAVLDSHPGYALVYADVIKTQTENQTFEDCSPTGRFRWYDWDRNLLLTKGCFIGPQPMWRRSIHDLYGYFDESLITSGDYEFWLRFSQTYNCFHLRETLGLYLESPDSIEHRYRDKKLQENHRILSIYWQAAEKGKIVGFQPLEELERVLWNSSCIYQGELSAVLDRIEALGGLKGKTSAGGGHFSANDSNCYFNLKNAILQGDRSSETIKRIIRSSSKLILNRTEWYPRYLHCLNPLTATSISGSVKISNSDYLGDSTMSIVEKMYEAIQPVLKASHAEDAIRALRNILSEFPEFGRGHNDLASLLYHAGQKQDALRHYEAAVTAAPDNPDFQKILGDYYYIESARIEDALRRYRIVLELRPSDIQTLLTIGNILISLKRFDEAGKYYRKVLDIDPIHVEAAETIRKLSARQGSRSMKGDAAESLYAEVQRLVETGDIAGGRQLLQKIVDLNPRFALAHNDLAVIVYQTGDKEQALYHYEEAARLEPNNITFQKNLADFYYVEQQRLEDALQLYVKVLDMQPDDIETLATMGIICSELHQESDARSFFERILQIEPWNVMARDGLERLDRGKPDCSKATNAQELHAEALRLSSSGDNAAAMKLLEDLIHSYPDFALAHNDLGVLLCQAGELQKATEHYEQAAQLEPNDAIFRKNLADSYWVSFGRTEDALKIYVDILKTHPEDIETLIATGKLCQSLGQSGDARVFFDRVVEIEPWNAEAHEQLRALNSEARAA